MAQYFTRFRGKIIGPMPAEQLAEMVRTGHVSGLHEYSADQQRWTPVSRMLVNIDGSGTVTITDAPTAQASPRRAATSPSIPTAPLPSGDGGQSGQGTTSSQPGQADAHGRSSMDPTAVLDGTRNSVLLKLILVPMLMIFVMAGGVLWLVLKAREANWSTVIAETRKSVFMVVYEVDTNEGLKLGTGTAWFVSPDTLATNSHVAEGVQRALTAGKPALLRSSGENYFDIAIVRTQLHPGYADINQYLRERAAALGKTVAPQSYFDVALLKITPEDSQKFKSYIIPLRLAAAAKLNALQAGQKVAFVGFSRKGVTQNIGAPEPFSHQGEIARITDEDENSADDPSLRTRLTYRLAIRGGASGSPVVDESGEVIGLIAAVAVQDGVSDSGTSYGPRADLVRELLNETGLPSWKAVHKRRLDRIFKN